MCNPQELEAERFSHCSDDSAFGGPSRAASAASVPEVLPALFPASETELGDEFEGAFDLPLSPARLVPERDTKLRVRGGVQKHKQPGSAKARGHDQPAAAQLEPVDALAIRDLLVDGDDG